MSTRIDTSDITRNLDDELNLTLELVDQEARKVTLDIQRALKAKTPRKTGFAANSIQAETEGTHKEVFSDCSYMPALNHGHSKQAPSGYWENTVDGIVLS